MADAVQQNGEVNPNLAPAFIFHPPRPQNWNNGVFGRNNWSDRPRRRFLYNNEHRELAIRLRQQGFSYRQIARRTGPFCSCGTIHKWLRRAQPQP